MTDLERIKKDVVEMDSRANVCWYDTKVLTKAVRLILEELTADRKTENSSEKPNNCEDLQDWKDRMWAEAIVTEPTISKMEQVDEPKTQMKTQNSNLTFEKADEPQIYKINPQEPTNMPKCFDCEDFFTCDGQCDEIECEKCKHFIEEADTYTKQCEFYFMECKYEPKDEPQTDCAWR